MNDIWSIPVALAEVDRNPVTLAPTPDAATLAKIAKTIGVDDLKDFSAEVTLVPWFDGVELKGRFAAVATQTCGLSLDPFDSPLKAHFTVRAVPPESPHAPKVEGAEIAIDPDADDPPDVLDGDVIDVGAYLVEHLALEVDPFPRKPDAVFEQPGGAPVISPFAALAALKDKDNQN